MHDWLILNGTIVSGDGKSCERGDLAIAGGRIVEIGTDLSKRSATQILDAVGKIVTPGFVDIHSHCDLYPLVDPQAPAMVHQGITTALAGNCSLSVAPCDCGIVPMWSRMFESIWGKTEFAWQWGSMKAYLDQAEGRPLSVNLSTLAGVGPIRLGLGGDGPEPCAADEIQRICVQALDQGAFGISLGLAYFPNCYSATPELEAAARAVADSGTFLAIHMASYGDELIESTQACLRLAERTGCSLQISHLYAAGRDNWPKLRQAIDLIADANARGIDVHFDRHPYAAGSTTILSILPPWAQEGGIDDIGERLRDPGVRDRMRRDLSAGLPQWDCFARLAGWPGIIIPVVPGADRSNLSIADMARLMNMDEVDALAELVIEHGPTLPVVLHHMEEDGVVDVLNHPLGMVGSDSLFSDFPHPRTFGTYARWLEKYARQESRIDLASAVRKATSLPCEKMGIADRGLIESGRWADILVIDYEGLTDHSTFEHPTRSPTGIDSVFVNGGPAKLRGELTSNHPGRVLRRRFCATAS